MTWSWGGGVVTWSRGGRCCDLVLGGTVVLWPGPRVGGVVTWSRVGGRSNDLVPRGKVLCPDPMFGGREVLWPGLAGEVGFVTSPLPPLFSDRMTNTCENITFARFTTRAVIISQILKMNFAPLNTRHGTPKMIQFTTNNINYGTPWTSDIGSPQPWSPWTLFIGSPYSTTQASAPCRNINSNIGVIMVDYEIYFFLITSISQKYGKEFCKLIITEIYYKIGRSELCWNI